VLQRNDSATSKLADSPISSPLEGLKDSAAHQSIWNLPNQLTVARLVLSVIFFILLGIETHVSFYPGKISVILNVSILVFLLAVVTDFLDGYLARKWGLVSTFGRIADPFADKIVVCGGFVMLIGVSPRLVEPWFPVVIIFREFLVSGLRSFLESRGVAFGAAPIGKLKMLVQSIAIPMVLLYQANFSSIPAGARGSGVASVVFWLTVTLLILTLLTTITSSFEYVQRAIKLIREEIGKR
jgi:CDP-diacylglycerol--glycerol-3-phosphate 3-phosphatidyltransferase